MSLPGNIILVGMPGSGKSTLGRALATHTSRSFYDLDDVIEREEQCTIAEIFNSAGEEYFRKVEHEMLNLTLLQQRMVLATGGGTPCFFNHMTAINQAGTSIFLDVPPSELIARLECNLSDRPKLSSPAWKEDLKNTYQKRRPFYQKAHFILSGTDLRLTDIVNIISESEK